MRAFIKLTDKETEAEGYVNTSVISAFEKYPDGDGSIVVIGEEAFNYKETPEEILGLMHGPEVNNK